MTSKYRIVLAFSVMLCALLAVPSFGAVIFNNGPIVTHPGGMTAPVAGADRSAIGPGGTIFGFGGTGAVRLADDFTIAQPFTINSIQVFGYLTGATAPGGTAMTARIFSGGPPGVGTQVWGDTTTNIRTSNGWMVGNGTAPGVYRTTSTDTAGTTRRVQEITADGLSVSLPAGSYWIDFNYTGISFTPPISSPSMLVVGNAQQSLDSGATYAALLDGTTPQDVPFILNGSIVPEPATLSLLALVISAGLACRRR